MSDVKRLQIMIEEELDDLLALEAHRQRTSKAALIRRYVRDRLRPKSLPPLEEDPLWKFVGADPDTEPVEDIDEFLYGSTADA
jgi:hypothetical protein